MRRHLAGQINLLRVVLLLAVFWSPTSSISAHPFHVSFAEAEWNADTKMLEVALKVNPNDLEDALRRRTKRRIHLETDAAEKVIVQYLRDSFTVRRGKNKDIPLKWVGSEISVKDAWLYFEFPLQEGLNNITIQNSILSHVRDQKNTVSIRNRKQRATLVFSHQKTELPVKFASVGSTGPRIDAQ